MKKRDLRPIAGPGREPGNDQIVVPVFPRPVFTSSTPTVPGLYWCRHKRSPSPYRPTSLRSILDVGWSAQPHYARVWLRNYGNLEALSEGFWKDVRGLDWLWAGPLPEPIEFKRVTSRPRTRKK